MAKEDNTKNDDFRYIIRVNNTDLDGEKKILDSLRKIKGVSFMFANAICQAADVDSASPTGLLSDKQVSQIQAVIDDPTKAGIPSWILNRRKDYQTGEDRHVVTNELILEHGDDIKRLKKIKSYRGIRHTNDLPSRGQRTKSNFRSNKGKKR